MFAERIFEPETENKFFLKTPMMQNCENNLRENIFNAIFCLVQEIFSQILRHLLYSRQMQKGKYIIEKCVDGRETHRS